MKIEFRHLSHKEAKEFRAWTRKNYTVGDPINTAYHPVVQEECHRLNRNKLVHDTYFDSFTAAITHVREVCTLKGYVLVEDSYHSEITHNGGYTRARPPMGKTHRFNIELVDSKKCLHIQVYGMSTGKYELNFYVS